MNIDTASSSTAPSTATPASVGAPADAEAPKSSKEPTIDVSPKAVEAIRRQLGKRGTPDAAIRLGIRGGGCSGFSYVIEFHDGPARPRDREFLYGEARDVRVVVDPKSLVYLNGTTLEWEQTLMRQGFKFLNPQEKANCGCGHSFTV